MTKEAIVDGLYRGDSTAIKEAINVLQQPPCEDCVSRQSVTYIIKSYIHEIITESGMDKNAHTNNVLRLIADIISTMQPVTPSSRAWTPVSEGLPDEDEDVLITYRYSGERVVTMAYKESNGWKFDDGIGWVPNEIVTAWMPLPTPYEGEKQ